MDVCVCVYMFRIQIYMLGAIKDPKRRARKYCGGKIRIAPDK